MYQNIIVGLGLEHGFADRALSVAEHLLSDGGKICALHVIEPLPGMTSYFMGEADETKIKAEALSQIETRIIGRSNVKAQVLFGHPGRLIPEFATEINADCIVVGSHKPDMINYLLGETAARIVRHAKCPVHVLR